jgi:flagellar assembly factor FliW
MKLKTKQFGEIEFDEHIIIKFPEGILGFEKYKKFLLIIEDESLFYWLTSIDEPELVFPLFPTRLLEENFPSESDYEAFGIVKLDKNPSNVTINLKAPIYLNQNEKVGFQKIFDNENYPIDYKLFIEN